MSFIKIDSQQIKETQKDSFSEDESSSFSLLTGEDEESGGEDLKEESPIHYRKVGHSTNNLVLQKEDPSIEKALSHLELQISDSKLDDQDLQVCSRDMFYNYMQNEGDKIIVFDTRSIFKVLKRQVNYNMKFNHNIPLCFDFLAEKQLKIKDY